MILTDTGPLVALINKNDGNHVRCLNTSKQLSKDALLTTWPCFTEAMFLLFQAGGYPAQAELWRWRAGGRLVLHNLSGSEIERMSMLMNQYRDRPMDLADASLIAIAESLSLKTIYTLDSDFYIYRLMNGSVLDCIP